MTESKTFGVTFSNVPIINLRWEFREYYERAHTPGFLHQRDGIVRPLVTRYFMWGGMPQGGATMMLGRAIVGIEAYVCFAALFGAAPHGRLTNRLRAACRNPFVLGGGTADNYFNRLPSLIAPQFAMKSVSAPLWSRTLAFYREIRNPIFHGEELSKVTEQQFAGLFEHLADMYGWLDGWYDPEDVTPGATKSFAVQAPSPRAT